MKRLLFVLPFTLMLALVSGCGRLLPTAATSTYPAPITTEPMPPSETPRPTVSLPTAPPATATPAATPTPFAGMAADVMVDNLFLRAGPGFLHEAYWTYPEGERVEAWGRAPGWSWVYVKTDNDLQGWMKLELLTLEGDFYALPETIPEGFVIVRGHVYAADGSPASHITLSLVPPGGDSADEDAATTDNEGRFYFFLPQGSSGEWTLAASAYGCESSAVDANCSLMGSFPPAQQVDVRESAEVWYNLQLLRP